MLIRAIFWLSLVVLFLPVDRNKIDETSNAGASIPISFAMLQSVASDLGGFCDRNLEACTSMVQFARSFGTRLQIHTQSLGNYLASLDDPSGTGLLSPDPVTTSSVSPITK